MLQPDKGVSHERHGIKENESNSGASKPASRSLWNPAWEGHTQSQELTGKAE